MKCPNCETNLIVSALVPDEQRVTFAISFESDLVPLAPVAGAMQQADKILRLTAEQVGQRVHVFLERFEIRGSEVKFTLLLTAVGAQPEAPPPSAAPTP